MSVRMAVAAVGAVIAIGSVDAAAQGRFEVGLLLGSSQATDEGTVLQFDRGRTYQATFAWRLWSTETAQLSVAVPFTASPAFTIVPPGAALPLEYASLYLTPGVRVTFLPKAPVSFFGAIGGGRSEEHTSE